MSTNYDRPPTTSGARLMVQPISREDAHRQGKARYFTGVPCKRGHVAERYVLNGNCTDCHNWKRIPAMSAWNAVLPPSPMIFPADMKPSWLTPELVSRVWGMILKDVPKYVDAALKVHNLERAATRYERLKPQLTDEARMIGWQSYEQMRSAGNTDHQLYLAALLVPPTLADGSPDWLEWLADGGTHQQAIENGMIVDIVTSDA